MWRKTITSLTTYYPNENDQAEADTFLSSITEAVLPVEIGVQSTCMALSGVLYEARPEELEALDEKRDKARSNPPIYYRLIARAYE